MKRLFPLILLPLLALTTPVSAQGSADPSADSVPTEVDADPATRDGLFIHISSGPDFPHRALMALHMADKASAAGNLDVFVYFDIKGVELVVEGFPEINFEGFPSSRVLLARLQERHVPMAACPSCLKVISRTEAELIPGVQPASLDAFFGFTKGRILTLDY